MSPLHSSHFKLQGIARRVVVVQGYREAVLENVGVVVDREGTLVHVLSSDFERQLMTLWLGAVRIEWEDVPEMAADPSLTGLGTRR